MRVTIIPSDKAVIIDGVGVLVEDVTQIAERIHAVQWDGTKGHIEYVQHEDYYTPNVEINNLDAYEPYIQQALDTIANPPAVPELPLPMLAYKIRQQIAFTQAKTADFGVQYSDPVSIGMINSLVALFDKELLTGEVNYKGPNGFISLNKDEMLALAGQVAAHVQKAFNAEKEVLERIQMGTITTKEQVQAAFIELMSV